MKAENFIRNLKGKNYQIIAVKKEKLKIKREEDYFVSLIFIVSFSISSGSLGATPAPTCPKLGTSKTGCGQVKIMKAFV